MSLPVFLKNREGVKASEEMAGVLKSQLRIISRDPIFEVSTERTRCCTAVTSLTKTSSSFAVG